MQTLLSNACNAVAIRLGTVNVCSRYLVKCRQDLESKECATTGPRQRQLAQMSCSYKPYFTPGIAQRSFEAPLHHKQPEQLQHIPGSTLLYTRFDYVLLVCV